MRFFPVTFHSNAARLEKVRRTFSYDDIIHIPVLVPHPTSIFCSDCRYVAGTVMALPASSCVPLSCALYGLVTSSPLIVIALSEVALMI